MRLFQNYQKIAICIFTTLSFLGVGDFSVAEEIYPSRAVTIIVGYGAGGSTDIVARAAAPVLQKIWGQPVVVVNKPGAAGSIMMEFIRHSPPDGYTLGALSTGTVMGTLLKESPYHLFNDFTHIAQLGSYNIGLVVHTDSPWKTAKDLVEYGQKNPGKLRYGSAGGVGTSTHTMSEQFGFLNNFKWVHVPFDGEATSLAALLGKHIDVAMLTPAVAGPHIKAGKLRLLLFFFENRSRDFPDVPTARELGIQPDLYKYGIFGFCGPKNLPTPVVEKISSTVKATSQDPDVIKILEKQYMLPTYRGGEEWVSFLKKGLEEEATVMKKIGLKVVREDYK